ncbi:MAG: anaerobic carbon-monoxide dehydrogenase catalytic subunit, partial [Planctomycetes bacterium]|nr:anaerobic carbon-monoxide dehydrogenase catalytic subunit [Planctomycetota bacterium]
MGDKMKSPEELVSDGASIEVLHKAENDCTETCFSRASQQKPCNFGLQGICCRMCFMGPCRITKTAPKGVCGADEHTIVARNYLRAVAAGTAAHSDHARHLVLRLKKVAEKAGGGYEIRGIKALYEAANNYGVETEGRSHEEIAGVLADVFLDEFSKQEKTLQTLTLAPVVQQNIWKKHKIESKGIDRMVVEGLHRSTMGVDHDYKSVLTHAFRTSLADGWGGSRIAAIVSDILFGTSSPVKGEANLGVLKEDTVNIVVHGHEPALSEMLAIALRYPEVSEYAKKAGAKGVTLAGICCTANEILMRHGIPVAGSFMQQELAIITGAVEMMVVDVQACMPSLPGVAASYHTEVVSTSEIARTLGAHQVEFDADDAIRSAINLIKRAIDNYAKRDRSKMAIPDAKRTVIAGFSVDAIKYMLGGTFRASFRPLNDAIIQGRIRGVVGIVGCNNAKAKVDDYINHLTAGLVARGVLVLKTGCAAVASAKTGMMRPEAALEKASQGLREVCETVGIPPVLHMGSCVDNARILEAATEIVKEGGLGDSLAGLPAVGVAPEWMSEKAVAIGCYFVASGVDVVLGQPFSISG